MTNQLSETLMNSLLGIACDEGNAQLKTGNVRYSEDSARNEQFMVQLLRSAAEKFGINPEVVSHLGGHAFPDVHFSGSHFGIELKGSRKGRAITGNSIFSGSMVENLKKVYLFYWIDDRDPKLGFRDYFECVFDAKVTHSPRFALQVDLPPEESMFGDNSKQLGFTAVDWLSGERKYVDRIVEEIRRRALERDEIPWWVQPEGSDGNGFEPDSAAGLGGLRNLRQMGNEASFSLQKTLFLGFPEVLAGGRAAHANAIGWAISRKSAIIGRDVFSAGGQRRLNLGSTLGAVTLPAVIGNCATMINKSNLVSLNDLSEIYGQTFTSADQAIKRFRSTIKNNKDLEYLRDYLPLAKQASISARELSSTIADLMADLIDPLTLR